MVAHFFTVDVEEYFHVSAFEGVVGRADWAALPSRVERALCMLLEDLAAAGATGTFFVLGWLARENPALVRHIVAAGHEIASHGFWHQRVNSLVPSTFRSDVRASKDELEQITGLPVAGYRAPSFSIVPGSEWAFDVLLEEGYTYDSSVFPIRRRGYGYPSAPRVPHTIRRASGTLTELPLATTEFAGLRWPVAGGGYLRHFPFGVIRNAFARANAEQVPATFYIHPWELDPDQPRMPVGPLTRIRHYRGLTRTRDRVQTLLAEFRFTSIASWLRLKSPYFAFQENAKSYGRGRA